LFKHLEFLPSELPPLSFCAVPDGAATTQGRTRSRVLVVDDEMLIANTIAAILNENGFEALAAFSGEEALATALTFRPDILLTDVLMPKMSGVELGMQLTKQLPEARILLFSGQAATMELMRKAEADGYRFELFPKPIHPDELIARLKGL